MSPDRPTSGEAASDEKARADELLVRELLGEAGLPSDRFAIEPFGRDGVLNRHLLVTAGDGRGYVARIYDWRIDGAEPYDRHAKEAWLLPRLAAAGVPAPVLLSSVAVGDERALLVTLCDGEALETTAARGPAGDLVAAWRSVGQALRGVHEVALDAPCSGSLTADGVVPWPEGSWGGHVVAEVSSLAAGLARSRPELHVDPDAVTDVVARARLLLDAAPVHLSHGDAHARNVLVARDGPGWRCTAWLDWEFAAAADPAWDLVYFDLARTDDVGPTPDAFYDGYGGRPPEPTRSVYELDLHLLTVLHSRRAHGREIAAYTAGVRYLAELPSHLGRLAALTG